MLSNLKYQNQDLEGSKVWSSKAPGAAVEKIRKSLFLRHYDSKYKQERPQ